MSYRLDNKDIVIEGFESGIADSPHKGIGDMRNVNIVSVPGEASVQFKQTSANIPPVMNGVAYTASASTDRLTVSNIGSLYEGCAISLSVTPFAISYLVVGGGGGGGSASAGGGGGAGGVIYDTTSGMIGGSYAITIGGAGVGSGTTANGTNGGDTTVGSLFTAVGGGGGASSGSNNGSSGGSGGGARAAGTGGGHTTGQGNDGGAGNAGGASKGSGGGGQSGGGGTASSTNGGGGGAGITTSISGASLSYAGGGGGGTTTGNTPGTGGSGVGGNGGGTGAPTAGTTNRGGGGGGGGNSTDGANGGSGVAIFSYATGTVTATGGTITTSGGNTIHTFTTNGTFAVSGGLTSSIVYYVQNIVGNTFQLSTAPLGSIVDIAADSAGTLTTYQVSRVRAYFTDINATNGLSSGVYFSDSANKTWGIFPVGSAGKITANSLIFLGNIGGQAGSLTSGFNLWKDYLFLFGATGVDVANLNSLFSSGPASAWSYGWWSTTNQTSLNNKIATFVGQADTLYFTTVDGLGSVIEVAGTTFNSSNSGTYIRSTSVFAVQDNDSSTCIGEVSSGNGASLIIGGRKNYLYVWDQVSPLGSILVLADNLTTNIVSGSQNAYVFAGNRGRIYLTNGSGLDLYKKVPDYVTGEVSPYINWNDASFSRNQVYFTFNATKNDGTVLTTVNGVWGINIATDAMYFANKITNSGYSGVTTMAVEMPPYSGTNPAGSSLVVGWDVSGTYGIDIGSSQPYQSLETYIETDLIPVGTYLKPFTPSQIEWKTSVPLGGNGTPETIRILYRKNLFDSFTQVGTTTIAAAPTENSQNVSDFYQTNFEKAQWIQLRVEMSSNATTPTYNRLTELRIREYPST